MTTREPGNAGPDSATGSGSDEGTAGERHPVPPDDEVAAAVEDDAPLPADRFPGGGDSASGEDEPDDDTPQFREPGS